MSTGLTRSPAKSLDYSFKTGACAPVSQEPLMYYQGLDTEFAGQECDVALTSSHGADSRRKGRLYHPKRNHNVSARSPAKTVMAASSLPRTRDPIMVYPCTKCDKSFHDACRWKRHEASVHGKCDLTGREWTCMRNEPFMLNMACVFCSEVVESLDHYDKHDIQPCLNKCTTDRTFALEHLLKQHIKGSHLKTAEGSAIKNIVVPIEWSNDKAMTPAKLDLFWCGFCRLMHDTIELRMKDVARHFEQGSDMADWIPRVGNVGNSGL